MGGERSRGVTKLGVKMSINALEKHTSRICCSADGRTISLGDNAAVTAMSSDRLTSRALHFPMKSQHEVLETR